jgi:hypothetical protein
VFRNSSEQCVEMLPRVGAATPSGARRCCADDEVKAKLRSLPLRLRREIGYRLFLLEDNLSGSVKKLKALATNTDCASAITASLSNSKVEPQRDMLSVTAKLFTDEHSHSETEIRDCKSHRRRRH